MNADPAPLNTERREVEYTFASMKRYRDDIGSVANIEYSSRTLCKISSNTTKGLT